MVMGRTKCHDVTCKHRQCVSHEDKLPSQPVASTTAAAPLCTREGWKNKMTFVAHKNPVERQNVVSPIRCFVKQLGISCVVVLCAGPCTMPC